MSVSVVHMKPWLWVKKKIEKRNKVTEILFLFTVRGFA